MESEGRSLATEVGSRGNGTNETSKLVGSSDDLRARACLGSAIIGDGASRTSGRAWDTVTVERIANEGSARGEVAAAGGVEGG